MKDSEIVEIMRPHLLAADGGYLCDLFPELVAAAGRALLAKEREECARICEETWVEPGDSQTTNCSEAAAKIRARNDREEPCGP